MDLTTLTDEDLDALRVLVLTEQERRRTLVDAPAQAFALADRYATAIGRQDGDPWVQPTGAHDAVPFGVTRHRRRQDVAVQALTRMCGLRRHPAHGGRKLPTIPGRSRGPWIPTTS